MSTKLPLLFVVAGMCLVGYSLYDYDPPFQEPINWPEPLKPGTIVETQPEKPVEPIVEPQPAIEIPSEDNRSTDESDTAATCVGTPDSSAGLRTVPLRRLLFRRWFR